MSECSADCTPKSCWIKALWVSVTAKLDEGGKGVGPDRLSD